MRFRTGAVALLFLMASAIGALAQTTTVQGFVKDPSGPVAGAQVLLKDIDTGRKYPLKTDKKGKFFSIGITPGKFDVTVSKDNKVLYTTQFQATLQQDVNELDIDLTPAQPGQAAAPPPPQPGTQQQQPKLQQQQRVQQLSQGKILQQHLL